MNFFSLFKRKIIYQLRKKIKIDNVDININNLDELFNFYGSDKAEIFKESNSKGHGFSNFYEKCFENLKQNNLNILEIGSYAGASAAAFSKFLPNSKIFCFDVNISNFKYSAKNIFVFGLDVRNEKNVEKKLKKILFNHQFDYFDFIIDDGSHNLSDILFSLKYFFKYLKKSGVYVIEDFKHPNYYKYNKDVDDILIDKMLENLKQKQFFQSSILDKQSQLYLFNNIGKIEIFKGNLANSDICFLEKKIN